MNNISERRGSRIITYFISEEGCKFPSFEWMLERVEMDEEKTIIFRLFNQTLIFSKSDFNSCVIMYHKTEYGWTDRFTGVYSYMSSDNLVLRHAYYETVVIDLDTIKERMCEEDGGLSFDFNKINIAN